MAKTVISLVKELGAKNTAEVLELLAKAGVDTGADDFGIMSKVEDDVVARLHKMRSGEAPEPATNGEAKEVIKKAARPARRIADKAEELDLESNAGAKRKSKGKDFFGLGGGKPGTKEAPAEEEAQADKDATAEEKPSETTAAAGETQKTEAKPKAGAAPDKKKSSQKKTDLSGGPRIISMPDPQEQARLRQQREMPQRRGAPPAAGDAAKTPGGRGKDKKKGGKADHRRKGRKDGGGREAEFERSRSRKRVFKVAGQPSDQPAVVPKIKITGPMQLRDVAKETGVKVADIVRFLMQDLEIMATINYSATVEEIQLIAENFGIEHTVDLASEPESELQQFEDIDEDKLTTRPPVVTVMGHVDHGKTKLLDTIRAANVVDGESGGITQHIGAYMVEKQGKKICFLDTPGHEAFTQMRARGSQVTDIVILVVAADDGVMPQTVEAINHAKAAKVPIIVAVNKMDKPDANPEVVKNQLSEHELVSEEWGGDTVFVNVSALKGDGIDDLLEMILLNTELLDPKADPTAPPYGVVIESKIDTGIGVVATVLVQQGTMSRGQFILSGTSLGRIKRMENERGEEVDNAGPSNPVRIIGFSDAPENGERIYSFKNKKQATAIADQRLAELRKTAAAGASGRMTLEAFFQKAEAGETGELNVIVKADVGGSAEALEDALKKLDVEGYKCKVISSGVGQVNETDVNLAVASGAVIIAFHAGVAPTAKRLAEREKVDIRQYEIIYKVTEDFEMALKGMLEPEFEEKQLGRVEVRAIFKKGKAATVAGGYVLDGIARRNAKYRLKRAGEVIFEDGHLSSLKRFQDDVKEVASGFECGFLIENSPVQPEEGDILELFEVVEIVRV